MKSKNFIVARNAGQSFTNMCIKTVAAQSQESGYGTIHKTMDYKFEELSDATDFIEVVQTHSVDAPTFTLVYESEVEQEC